MDKKQKVDFLLGAISPGGFYGYFTQLQKPQKDTRLLLIKAGPGCGKSTLMKKISNALAARGELVEEIHCSSDPDSLDGVICEGRKFAVIDATAPHSLEPRWPIGFEEVVSLYDLMDRRKLLENQEKIVSLWDICDQLHERAGRYITAAGSLVLDTFRLSSAHTDFEKAAAYGRRLAARALPDLHRAGSESVRMLTAMTLHGPLIYSETVTTLAKNPVILEDEQGPAAKEILNALREEALKRGYHIITCYCAMFPGDKIDHLIIPEAGFAVVTSNHFHPFSYPGVRRVHCERFCDKSALSLRRKRMRFNQRAAAELIAQASALQKEAKEYHDQLEVIYKSAMQFEKLDQLTAALVAAL